MMKQLLKSLLGLFYCKLYGVKYHHGIYVGLGAKLVGAKIHLSNDVKVMPQAMLVSLGGKIEIGEKTEISMYSRVASMGLVKIGNHVLMGPHVFIADYSSFGFRL